jgi:hypothetical protein
MTKEEKEEEAVLLQHFSGFKGTMKKCQTKSRSSRKTSQDARLTTRAAQRIACLRDARSLFSQAHDLLTLIVSAVH